MLRYIVILICKSDVLRKRVKALEKLSFCINYDRGVRQKQLQSV